MKDEIADSGVILYIDENKEEYIIEKTVFESSFNEETFSKLLKKIVKSHSNKKIEYYLKSDTPTYKRVIKILKGEGFTKKLKKIVFTKEIEKRAPIKKIKFKSLDKVDQKMFFKVYLDCIMSSEDRDLKEDKKDPKMGFKKILNPKVKEWNLLAFDKREVIGLLILQEYETYYSINLISTTPKYRGRGYANLLLQKAELEFLKDGKNKKWLGSTDEKNKPMIKSFEKYGFKKVRDLYCFIRRPSS